MSYNAQQAYQEIKNLEPSCPLLSTRSIVVIGTLDAQAGTFDWALPLYTYTQAGVSAAAAAAASSGTVSPRLPIQPPPPPVKISYRVANPQSIQVTLRFEVKNLTGTFSVEGFGQTAQAPSGQTYADLVLGAILAPGTNSANCLLRYGPGSKFTSVPFVILQPPVAAAGAFTIPVLPVALVYAPPQAAAGSSSKFTSTYTTGTSTARAVTTSVSSTNSTKSSTAYTTANFISYISSAVTEVTSIASSIGSIVNASTGGGSPSDASALSSWTKGITSFLNLLSSVLAQTTVSTQTGLQVTSTNKVTVTVTNTEPITTVPGTGLGPGKGDIFVYYYNVLAVWIVVNGALGISVLGYDGQGEDTAKTLQAGTATAGGAALSSASVAGLLQLDPFTGESPYYLNPNRFVPLFPPQLSLGPGTSDARTLSYSITQEDTQTSVQTQTTITDYKPGWLDALFGDNEATENTITTSYTTTDDITVGDSVQNSYSFTVAASDPTYAVDLWYDRLFGNFAYITPGLETQTTTA